MKISARTHPCLLITETRLFIDLNLSLKNLTPRHSTSENFTCHYKKRPSETAFRFQFFPMPPSIQWRHVDISPNGISLHLFINCDPIILCIDVCQIAENSNEKNIRSTIVSKFSIVTKLNCCTRFRLLLSL